MFGFGGRRGYGYGYGYGRESLLDEMLEIDEMEDLMEGDLEGAMEDEILRDFI